MAQVDLTLCKVCEHRWASVGTVPLPVAHPGSVLEDSQSHVPTASEPVSEHVAFLGPSPTPTCQADSAQTQVFHPQPQVSAGDRSPSPMFLPESQVASRAAPTQPGAIGTSRTRVSQEGIKLVLEA